MLPGQQKTNDKGVSATGIGAPKPSDEVPDWDKNEEKSSVTSWVASLFGQSSPSQTTSKVPVTFLPRIGEGKSAHTVHHRRPHSSDLQVTIGKK